MPFEAGRIIGSLVTAMLELLAKPCSWNRLIFSALVVISPSSRSRVMMHTKIQPEFLICLGWRVPKSFGQGAIANARPFWRLWVQVMHIGSLRGYLCTRCTSIRACFIQGDRFKMPHDYGQEVFASQRVVSLIKIGTTYSPLYKFSSYFIAFNSLVVFPSWHAVRGMFRSRVSDA
jgi:hypothetical protein